MCILMSYHKDLPTCLMDEMSLNDISTCIVSYTDLQMKTDLHIQTTLSQLQKYQQTILQIFVFFSENSAKMSWQIVLICNYCKLCQALHRQFWKLWCFSLTDAPRAKTVSPRDRNDW